jgi:hypothetical protein
MRKAKGACIKVPLTDRICLSLFDLFFPLSVSALQTREREREGEKTCSSLFFFSLSLSPFRSRKVDASCRNPNYLGSAALVNTDALLGVSTLNCTALFAKQSVMQQHGQGKASILFFFPPSPA